MCKESYNDSSARCDLPGSIAIVSLRSMLPGIHQRSKFMQARRKYRIDLGTPRSKLQVALIIVSIFYDKTVLSSTASKYEKCSVFLMREHALNFQ